MVGTGRLAFVDADVRNPDAIVSCPELNATLDMTQPVAVSLAAVMHFVSDEDNPYGVVETLVEALAAGSFLAMTHITADFDEHIKDVAEIYRNQGMTCVPRTREEFAAFFTGLDVVDPGITGPHRWNPSLQPAIDTQSALDIGAGAPDDMDRRVSLFAGVARKS